MEPLILALKDKNPNVRMSATKALVRIGDPRAVEPLIAALNDKNEYVRKIVARELSKITDRNFGEDPIKWQTWWDQNKGK